MNIQNEIIIKPLTIVLTAGQHLKLDQMGNYFLLKSNTGGSPVHVALGNDRLEPWPILWSWHADNPDDFFDHITIYNPNAVTVTVEIAIAKGVIDNKSAQIIGVAEIDNTSNTITTPVVIVALPVAGFLINNAAAVNVGGGVVGIPVTGQPFATGESITITGTVNYDGTYPVLVSSTANQVNITVAYNAEVFDGVNDTIALTTPRSIAANSNRKSLEIHNHDAAIDLYFGDVNVNAVILRGIPITPGNGEVIESTAAIYFAAPAAAGKTGVTFSYAEHSKV